MNFLKCAAVTLGVFIASFSLNPSAQATGDLWLETSYEFLDLPATRFITEFTGDSATRASFIRKFENHNGNVDGIRLDAGLTEIPLPAGGLVWGVKGFYAWHEGAQDLSCGGQPTILCGPVPIVAPSVIAINVPGNFGFQTYRTELDVDHWGTALQLSTQGHSNIKGGLAFRQIDTEKQITGSESGPAGTDRFTLNYSEDLEANYWGGFIGSVVRASLGSGVTVSADGEVGLYWMDADYSGSYGVSGSIFVPTANLNQSLSLSDDAAAVIASLKLSIEQDLGVVRLALFGRGEWISNTPDVAYNNVDRSAAFIFAGNQDGTRLDTDDAYALSVGGRVTVPLGADQ